MTIGTRIDLDTGNKYHNEIHLAANADTVRLSLDFNQRYGHYPSLSRPNHGGRTLCCDLTATRSFVPTFNSARLFGIYSQSLEPTITFFVELRVGTYDLQTSYIMFGH
jgi:hypothetical protein